MSFVKLKLTNVTLKFRYRDILLLEREQHGKYSLFNVDLSTGKSGKNNSPEDMIMIKNMIIETKENYTNYIFGDITYKYERSGPTLKKYDNGVLIMRRLVGGRIANGFNFTENGKEYVWYIPSDVITPRVYFMRDDIMEYNREIYIPFTLNMINMISGEDIEKIKTLVLIFTRSKIRMPKYLIQKILADGMRTYQKIYHSRK